MQCDRVLPEPRPWGDPQPERVSQSLLLWYCASASSGVGDIGNPLHPAKAAAKTSAIKTFAMVCIRFPLCWSSDESPRSAPCLCSRGNIVLISRVYRFFVSGNRLGTSVGTWAARLLFEAHACVAAHLLQRSISVRMCRARSTAAMRLTSSATRLRGAAFAAKPRAGWPRCETPCRSRRPLETARSGVPGVLDRWREPQGAHSKAPRRRAHAKHKRMRTRAAKCTPHRPFMVHNMVTSAGGGSISLTWTYGRAQK
jgi:hypothetical protein